MVYFCADDYGVSVGSNLRIENCLTNGVLNKISVLPNGDIEDFKHRLASDKTSLSLHINLVEGYPLSNHADVDMLISGRGLFRYSFAGLFLLSYSPKRKELEKQIYQEIKTQLRFWKSAIGDDAPVMIDSHQHTHMIPLVFKTLVRVIEDEGIDVSYMRISSEPILPYILTPSMYLTYSPTGLLKQWILNFLAFLNRREIKKHKLRSSYFMGALFSGCLDEKKIKKLLPRYQKLAEKKQMDIEIAFHPGYLKDGDDLLFGCREDFKKFYYSPRRCTEHDTLINLKL